MGERRGELEADFSPPEVRLIEGLLGVQGRGRSATSRQLKARDRIVLFLSIDYLASLQMTSSGSEVK